METAITPETASCTQQQVEAAADPADAAGPPADAAGPPADAAGPPADAAGPPADAAGPPADAAGPPADAAGPPADAAGPPADAAGPPADAAGPPADAAGPPADAAGPPADAAGPPEDAAGPPADAAGPQASQQREAVSLSQQLLPSIEEHPKIWLPRALRQTYIRKVGDTVNLLIPFQGKPKPQTTWTHNGSALDNGRVSVRNGERDSILFIREARRADSGCYQLCVQLGGLQATATINILVIEKPGPPQSIKLVDVWGSNATLEWTPPQDTGNTALLGYTVQKADKKSGLWFTVLERYHRTSCIVSDLIVGNSYAFRVFAENQCGLSETAPVTADLAHIQKAATVYKTKGFAQRDLSEAPKFTQPLADCTTITGYDTQLFCCVRASPRPKIIWLKNKMDLQGNPKYRALSHLGICSLEIRKPSPFDGGIYTCKAINALGEASVDCRVDVKAPH